MRLADLKDKKIVIWGTGREGKAAAAYLGNLPYVFVDEAAADGADVVSDPATIEAELLAADVVIKSPGVSLYHPLVKKLQAAGIAVTSLLNLWLAEPHNAKIICVTGTKGKSTTSSLLAHTLEKLGQRVALAGNIGLPITTVKADQYEYVIIETSSFQAADLSEYCDIAVLTSLYEDHIDWHGSKAAYHHDKLNLLRHAAMQIISRQARPFASEFPLAIYADDAPLTVANAYLARPHNLENVRTVLAILGTLGYSADVALPAMSGFTGLPHRQQELGEKNGILYVNDSISTTAYSAIAALNTYADRPVTLIAGGYDRGIDYKPLIERLNTSTVKVIILLGPSGARLGDMLQDRTDLILKPASSMEEAVACAQDLTAPGGVILLSPGAPSFGLFRDFVQRGEKFIEVSGF